MVLALVYPRRFKSSWLIEACSIHMRERVWLSEKVQSEEKWPVSRASEHIWEGQ